jgi:hypothetical protein
MKSCFSGDEDLPALANHRHARSAGRLMAVIAGSAAASFIYTRF